jgi:hypothetical protein
MATSSEWDCATVTRKMAGCVKTPPNIGVQPIVAVVPLSPENCLKYSAADPRGSAVGAFSNSIV